MPKTLNESAEDNCYAEDNYNSELIVSFFIQGELATTPSTIVRTPCRLPHIFSSCQPSTGTMMTNEEFSTFL